ncbi:MAG: hypothetical protein U1F30_03345 [Steroidobacteraceae bacterium]
MRRRRHAAEDRHVAVLRVAARLRLPGGAGLAGDAVAGDLRAHAGALGRHHRLEQPDQRAADGRIDHALAGHRVVGAQQRHRPAQAVGAQGRVGLRELQRRHRQAVAVGERRDADLAPVRIVRQQPGRFAREAARGHLAEAEVVERRPDLPRLERQRDLRHADVRGLGEHRRQVDGAERMLVLDGLGADLQEAAAGVDHAVGPVAAAAERRRDDERLDARARLEQVGRGAVAVHGRVDLLAVVGVVGRLVDDRQHFAAVDVDDHHRAGARAVVADRGLELAVGQVLDPQVDAQRQVAPRARGADALHVLHLAAAVVLDDALGAVLAGEPVVEGELGALLADVVDVVEADQVAGDLAGRVVAAVLARRGDARDVERAHAARVGRLQAAGDVEELAVEVARDAPHELLAVEPERARQARQLLAVAGEFAWVDPDRIDRRRHRQRLAEAVGDGAAVRVDRHDPREARVALAGEEAVVDQLQLDGAAGEQRGDGAQQGEQQAEPQAEGDRALRVAALGVAHHRPTVSISRDAGMRMRSLASAMRST